MKEVNGLKIRLKGYDSIIMLHRVPFDMNMFDEVTTALKTLGDNVNEIVTLEERTNKRMYFSFQAPEETLKKFFETYYNIMTWDEVQKRFAGRVRNKLGSDELIKVFKTFIREKDLEVEDIIFVEGTGGENYDRVIFKLNPRTFSSIFVSFTSKIINNKGTRRHLNKVLKKFKREIGDFKVNTKKYYIELPLKSF